jgi:hypothetical protein
MSILDDSFDDFASPALFFVFVVVVVVCVWVLVLLWAGDRQTSSTKARNV